MPVAFNSFYAHWPRFSGRATAVSNPRPVEGLPQEYFSASVAPFVKRLTPYDQMLTERQQDARLFRAQNVVSPKRALGFFMGGLLAGVGGAFGLKALLKRGRTKAANAVTTALHKEKDQVESTIHFTLNNPLASLFDLFRKKPEFRNMIGLYTMATGLGYVGSNFLQGFQEAMVRRAEVSIRAKLLKEMNGTFRDSLRIKQQYDDTLLQQAKGQIRQLLFRYGVPQPEALVNTPPLPYSTEAVRRLLYESRPWHVRPTNPTIPLTAFGGLFTQTKSDEALAHDIYTLNAQAVANLPRQDTLDNNRKNRRWQRGMDTAFFAGGAFVGVMIHQFGEALKLVDKKKDFAKKELNAFYYDLDAMLLRLKKPQMVLGYGLAAGVILSAKLLIDGFREVLVTQMHADTEYQYQKYNWKYLDPTYHATAESEALQEALIRLEKDLPKLRQNPSQLGDRIQVILENIGRMSAPKYFLMTPSVSLVEARS